jgi:hypothetical protein
MDQQHCSYSTILTNDRVKRRKPVQNKTFPKYASCLKQGTAKNVAKQLTFLLSTVLCLGQIQYNT